MSKHKSACIVRLMNQVIAANVGMRDEIRGTREMLKQGEHDRRVESLACAEVEALRSEMAQWDSSCSTTIAYLLSATFVYWTAVTTVVSQGKTEEWALFLTVLNVSVTFVWLIGHHNVFEKRFMIRRIAFYIRTELERRIFDGHGWESYIVKNRKWLDESFPRLPPIETECRIVLFVAVANALSLGLYADWEFDTTSANWSLSLAAISMCCLAVATMLAVISRLTQYRHSIGRRLSGTVKDARRTNCRSYVIKAIPDSDHVGAHAVTTETDAWGRYCLELAAISGPATKVVKWNVHVLEARVDRNTELGFCFVPEGKVGRIGNRMRTVSTTQTIETKGAKRPILGPMATLARIVVPGLCGDGWVALDLVVHSTATSRPASPASGVITPSGSSPSANP